MMKKCILLVLLLLVSSCINKDEPTESENVNITFVYTVPEELFRYAEITVCYNNNEGTDARWEPMLDNTFTVTYNINKLPVMTPVVIVYDTTNRSAYGVNVDWKIIMNIEVTMNEKTYVRQNVYSIKGDLGIGLKKLMGNVLDRTYAVKISREGDILWLK